MRTKNFLNLIQCRIRTKSFLNPQLVPKKDQDRGAIGKSLNRLVKPAHKFAKFVIENNSKVREPLTYNEA